MRDFLHAGLPVLAPYAKAIRTNGPGHRLRLRTVPDEKELCQWQDARLQAFHQRPMRACYLINEKQVS